MKSAAPDPVHSNVQASSLPSRLPRSVLLPYLIGSTLLALAYGSVFLLTDALSSAQLPVAEAGNILGMGTILTFVGALLAGRWAGRWGLLPTLRAAALAMGLAVAAFGLMPWYGIRIAYAGGLLLGLAWAVFYTLAPIVMIRSLQPAARIEAFALLSGAQMLGMGLSAPLARTLAKLNGSVWSSLGLYAALCLLAALLLCLVQQRLQRLPQAAEQTVVLTWSAFSQVLNSQAALPVLLMALAACAFSGLSTFQSLYAQQRGLQPDWFFLGFTVVTVLLRFTLAPKIARMHLPSLACKLAALCLLSIALLLANRGSSWLYGLAIVMFSCGYGLSYATFNAMAVNLAESAGISSAITSQVFTLGYFFGAFGFPFVAGLLLRHWNVNAVLVVLVGLMALNVWLSAQSVFVKASRD